MASMRFLNQSTCSDKNLNNVHYLNPSINGFKCAQAPEGMGNSRGFECMGVNTGADYNFSPDGCNQCLSECESGVMAPKDQPEQNLLTDMSDSFKKNNVDPQIVGIILIVLFAIMAVILISSQISKRSTARYWK
jgi:hypothetical protein